jgi:hypothetical protein
MTAVYSMDQSAAGGTYDQHWNLKGYLAVRAFLYVSEKTVKCKTSNYWQGSLNNIHKSKRQHQSYANKKTSFSTITVS